MSPSIKIPPPVLPPAPRVPMFGADQAAGMQQKRSAAAQAAFAPSFLGSQAAPGAGGTGNKTLLGQ